VKHEAIQIEVACLQNLYSNMAKEIPMLTTAKKTTA